MNKRLRRILTVGALLGLGLSIGYDRMAVSSAPPDPPTRPAWVMPDGRVNPTLLPTAFPVYDCNGEQAGTINLQTATEYIPEDSDGDPCVQFGTTEETGG